MLVSHYATFSQDILKGFDVVYNSYPVISRRSSILQRSMSSRSNMGSQRHLRQSSQEDSQHNSSSRSFTVVNNGVFDPYAPMAQAKELEDENEAARQTLAWCSTGAAGISRRITDPKPRTSTAA
jgi:hypothetical protein